MREHFSYSELFERLQGGGRTVAVLPVGCYEQHGPVLPLATDSIIAEALAEALAARLQPETCVHVFPPVHFTPTEPNRNFCGTVHIGNEIARGYFAQILESLLHHPFDAIVVVNGHGSVDPVLKEISFAAVYRQFELRVTPIRPVLCLNAFEFAPTITESFGQAPGRHAEWTELLLTFHLLGRAYYTPERLSRLETFAVSGNFHTPQPGVLGIPMELRSVDGVHGAPLPPGYPEIDLERESARLFQLVVDLMLEKTRRELDIFERDFRELFS